jgi:hypothetical protein
VPPRTALVFSCARAVLLRTRAEPLRGKRSGYCQRSRGEDANRDCKKEHDFEHSPRLVAGHMRPRLLSRGGLFMGSVQLSSRYQNDRASHADDCANEQDQFGHQYPIATHFRLYRGH